jgi:hypothetical protein
MKNPYCPRRQKTKNLTFSRIKIANFNALQKYLFYKKKQVGKNEYFQTSFSSKKIFLTH